MPLELKAPTFPARGGDQDMASSFWRMGSQAQGLPARREATGCLMA